MKTQPVFASLFVPVIAVSSLLAMTAQAQSLQELYESARSFDAAFQSAKSQYDANLAKAEQARASILPTVGLSAAATWSNLAVAPQIGPSSSRDFSAQTATVSASQPLFRPGNTATYKQGMKSIDLAQAVLQAADQDLIVRTTQAYFDVLASQDSLTFVLAQKAAVAEQLASAKRNFEVGTSTITDTREAQARYDLVIAQQIAAENDLRVKKIALDQLVGKSNTQPKALAQPPVLPNLTPDDVNQWVQQSEQGHPSIRQAQTALDVAQLESEKARASNKPTIDLVGSYGVTNNVNGSSSGTVGAWVNSATVGVQLNYPIFAGYAIQNRMVETLALEDKARNDLEGAKRAVAQGTRTAYFGVLSGMGQVKALEAAETSSQSALDANKLGYQVGVRINIDVLNSQSQLFQTKRDLAKARYDVLVGGLRLRQANGTLKQEDLQSVNGLLVK
jgi:outer membrane protein